jgi:autotransporter-associated beta strand protein
MAALALLVIFGLQPARAATDTWSTAPGSGAWGTAGNWSDVANNFPASGDSLVFGATTITSDTDNLMTPSTYNIAGITFLAAAPAYTINPFLSGDNGFTLTGGITNSSTSLETINDLITTTAVRTITLTSGGGNITLGGNINGTGGGFTTSGAGTLTLTGSNSFTGTTTVGNGGTLQLQANAANTVSGTSYALGSGGLTMGGVNGNTTTLQLRSDSSLTFNGGNSLGGLGGNSGAGETVNIDVNHLTAAGSNNTLTFGPAGFSVLNTTFNVTGGNGYTLALGQVTMVSGAQTDIFNPSTANLTINGITASASGAMTVDLEGASTGNSIGGAIANGSGTVAVNKFGTGTWTFNGAAVNTYTGATTINAGNLTLNFSNLSTPVNLINSSSALNLGGGTLQVVGKANVVTSQTFGNLTLAAGQSVISAAPASGSTIPTVAFGSFTATAPGNLIEFVGPATINASGSIAATATITTTTAGAGAFGSYYNGTNGAGIMASAVATVGLYDWATSDITAGTAGTSPYTIIGGSQVTGFYQSTGLTTTSAAYDVPGGTNASSGAASSPLVRFNASSSASINSTATTTSGILGILVTPNVGAHNDAVTANAGDGFEFSRQTNAVNGFGAIWQNNTAGFLNFSAIIEPGREGSGGGSFDGLVQAGLGTVVYSGVNLYELSTYLDGGYSVVFADSGFGNVADGGGTENGLVTNLYLNGGTIVGDANFTMDNAGANKRPVVLLGNGGGLAAAAGDTMTIDGVISGAAGTGPLIIGIPASTANSGTAGLLPGTGGGTANTTGTFATGTVVVNAANGYYGGTVIDSGVLNINGINALGGADYGGLTFNGGALQYASTLTSGADISIAGAGLTSASQAVTLASGTGTIDTNGNSVTLTQGIGNGGSGSLAVVSSIAGGSLTLSGNNTFTGGLILTSGNLTLGGANVYTGATTVTSGTLALNVGSSLSNTAISVASGATMTAALTGNANIQIGTAGATLTLSGGSLLSLQAADSDILDTLTLNGTGSATGTVLTVGGAANFATLNFDLSSTGADELVINDGKTGFNSFGGKITISDLDYLLNSNNPALAYTLITDPNGGLAVSASSDTADFWLGTTVLSLTGGRYYNLSLVSLSGTAVVLDLTASNPNFYWTGAGPGLTTTGSSSWSNIANFSTDQTGAIAQSGSLSVTSNVFLTATSASHFSQTLDGSYTINSLTFTGTGTSAASNSITLATGTGGPLTLNAANSYTDQNNVTYPIGTGLVVQPGSAAQAISANINLGNSQSWQINNSPSTPLTVSGTIGNGLTASYLTKTGTGELILSAADTYSGGTYVTAGTLALGLNNALLTSGTLTVSGTGTFDLAGHNQTLGALSDGGVSTGILTASSGTPTLTLNNTSANTFSGAITGSLGITMAGGGNLTLSNSNSYTGLTTVSAGSLIASNNYSLGNSASSTGGLALNPSSGTATVDFTSATPSIASLSSTGAGTSSIVLGATNAATTLTVTGAGSGAGTTFAGVISDQTPT